MYLVLFWLTFFLCCATYVGYPLAILFWGFVRPFQVRKENKIQRVTVIISAFNEERHIIEKIKNTLALDYPREAMEIIVGSDGSSDKTVELAREFEKDGVKILAFTTNRGKTSVQNDAVAASSGSILVFTDAASFLGADALSNIVHNFADERVGCVAGRLRFVGTDQNLTTNSQGLYWRYEVKVREMESALGRVIGVDGPLYAIRRENYVFLGPEIISDLVSPLLVLAHGKQVVLEPNAVVDEDPTEHPGQEFKTRRRITLRALTGIATHNALINPLRQPGVAVQLFFHKLLRWFVGPFCVVNWLCAVMLAQSTFYGTVSLAYGFLLILAAMGLVADRMGVRARALTVPYYFVLVNAAATMGIIDFLKGRSAVSWNPVRNVSP